MLFNVKRMLLIVMIMVITFCGVEVKAYFSFDKSSNVGFTTLGYADLTIATNKSVYGICNQEPTITLAVTNPNNYNVSYTLSFSNSNLTYKIDGANGATYTVNAASSKTHTIILSGSTTSTSLTVTVNATSPYKSSHTKTVTLDVSCPTASISSTTNVATSQTATLSCSDTEGMSSYYWGTKSSPAASEYTSQTSNLSTTKTVSSVGTYYLICKDKNGNTTSTSKIYRSYTVDNRLLNVTGSKGTYTTANYTSVSTKTYIMPNGTSIPLTSIYTTPSGGTYVGISSGAASTSAATLLSSNPTINANTTYTAWFNRNEYTITIAASVGGYNEVVTQNNTTGVVASYGNAETITIRSGESLTATAAAINGYTFTGWSGLSTGTTNSLTLTPNKTGTLTANFADKTAPSIKVIETTSAINSTSQTVTLNCVDGVGVTAYYFGTNNSPSVSDYISIDSTTNFTTTKTVSSAGTYFFNCKDGSENEGQYSTKVYRSYTIDNRLLTVTGTKGTYTSGNYASSSSATYIIPYGTTIPLANIYTTPTGGVHVGISNGVASSTSATLLTSNPTISANTTYTAWFNRIEYTVTVATGGNGSNKVTSQNNTTGVTATATGSNKTLTVRYGESITGTATPNSGYTFSGWSGASTSTTSPVTLTITSAKTLTANFSAKTYTVVYSCGTGSGSAPANQTVKYGSSITVDGTGGSCSKSGYTFSKWSDPTGDTSWTGWTGTWSYDNGTYGISGDVLTLTATWIDKTAPSGLSITSTNSVAESQTATIKCTDGVGVTKYYFGTSSSPSDSEYTTVTATTSLSTTKTVSSAGTYYLICKDAAGNTSSSINKTFYKTTLSMTNGSVSPTSVMTMSGNSFALPTPTASTGYTNKGAWYTSNAYSTSVGNYASSYKPASSATLYSIATANTYTVSYSCGSGSGTAPTSHTATYNSSFSIKENTCSKTGYTFVGWTVNSNGTADSNGWTGWSGTWQYVNGQYGIANGKLQLYPVWTINSYKLTYDCSTNGGSGNTSATINYNAAADLTKTCTKTGWKFVGWNTSSTATSKLSSFSMPAAADTLYAIYSKDVTVTFNTNGCATENKTATTTIYNKATSASVTVPTPTMKTNWTTLGASTSSTETSGTAAGSAISVSIASANTTGTAYFICKKDVTVTFKANGCATADGTASTTIYNGATTASVKVPTPTMKTSWTALGGSTSSSASSGTTAGNSLSVTIASDSKTGTAYFLCSKTFTATFNANGCTTAAKTASGTLYNGGTSISLTVPSATMNSGWTSLGASSSASSTSSGTAMGSPMSFTSIGSSTTTATRYYNCSKSAVTKSVTYSKGANVSAIGSTSGSCQIAAVYNGATQGTSCTVTLPTITANTGYTAVGWSTTNGATSGTAAGSSYTLSSASTTLYANATDQTKPSCSFGSWSPTAIDVDDTATIVLTCTDTGSGVATTTLTSSNFTISDTSALSISSITTASVTNGKSYTITVTGLNKTASPTLTLKASQVRDTAGNLNTAVASAGISVTADTVGPVITFGTDGNTTPAKSHSTKVTAEDASGVSTLKYYWTQTSGSSAASGTSMTNGGTATKSSGDGTWYLCAYAVDGKGNSTDKVCTNAFVFDNTKPSITSDATICVLKGTSFNLLSRVTATDANTVTLSASKTVSTSSVGTHSVTLTATDSAGNSQTKTVTVYVYTKLTNETLATSGSGLYADSYTSGRYLYRGSAPNNYVTFNGSSNWRIVAVNPDRTYKLVYMSSLGNMQFHSSKVNSFSGTTLETYLKGNYYSGLSSDAKNYIVSSGYYYNGNFGSASSSDTMAANVAADRATAYTGTVGLLSASDYILASTHANCTNYYYSYNQKSSVYPCSTDNYLYRSSGSLWWIMNGHTNGNARCFGTTTSNAALKNQPATNSYAVYPVVTLKNTTTFLGSGTSSNPYTICTACLQTGLSSTTCSIAIDSGDWNTSRTLTVTASSTSGITYSWDGTNYSSTRTKTISAAGTYTAFIKDSSGMINTCSFTVNSRTEYRKASCTRYWGSWNKGSSTCSGSESTYNSNAAITKSYAEANNLNHYYVCGYDTDCEYSYSFGGACYKWTRSCSAINCGSFGEWSTTYTYGTCTRKVETRTTYGV